MQRPARPLALLALPVLACLAWARPAPQAKATELTRQVTLYAHDFLRRTVSLATGEYGMAIEGHRVVNIDSELDFGNYYPDQMLAGVQGAQVGEMFDLGTGAELAQRYGYQETVGGGQGFASIHFENGQLVILADYAAQTFQPFTEGIRFRNAVPPTSSRPIDAQTGHLYLARITDSTDPQFERFVKLIVTAHTPDEQVSVAWQEILP